MVFSISRRGASPHGGLSCRGRRAVSVIGLLGLAMLCASCASKPAHYQGLASSQALHANTTGVDRRVAFNTNFDPKVIKAYGAITLEATGIYRGKDNQFGSLSEASKMALAVHADTVFAKALREQGLLAQRAGPKGRKMLSMRVTITGAKTSVPVVGTVSKVMPVGFAMNSLKLATDRQANFSGSVIYAVELSDTATGAIVYAFVTREYPNAMNIPASFMPLDAAKAGIDHGAARTAGMLRSLMGGASRQEPVPPDGLAR
jgi:hypothetical protein